MGDNIEHKPLEKELLYFTKRFQCYCCNRHGCNCGRGMEIIKIIVESVTDMIDVIVDVLVLCGMQRVVAKTMWQPMYHGFLYYEDYCKRVEDIPAKAINKVNFMYSCAMLNVHRTQSQIAYSIMKRAFRAYYHGTDERGVLDGNRIDDMKHKQECLWVHAAKSTARLIARYYGCFHRDLLKYEQMIKCVYYNFYQRRMQRMCQVPNIPCACSNCFQKVLFDDLLMDKEERGKPKLAHSKHLLAEAVKSELEPTSDPVEIDQLGSDESALNEYNEEIEEAFDMNDDDHESTESMHCNCSKLECNRLFDSLIGVVTNSCNQGPFTCVWLPTKEDERNDCISVDAASATDIETMSGECECECENENESEHAWSDDEEKSDWFLQQEEEQLQLLDINMLDTTPLRKYAYCGSSTKYAFEYDDVLSTSTSSSIPQKPNMPEPIESRLTIDQFKDYTYDSEISQMTVIEPSAAEKAVLVEEQTSNAGKTRRKSSMHKEPNRTSTAYHPRSSVHQMPSHRGTLSELEIVTQIL